MTSVSLCASSPRTSAGTPVQNNLGELHTLLRFLMPSVFEGGGDEFNSLFGDPFRDGHGGCSAAAPSSSSPLPPPTNPSALDEEERLLLATRLHQALRPFVLRRVKESVAPDLPAKREVLLRVAPSGYQRALARAVARAATADSGGFGGNGGGGSTRINNALMELRVIANHPFLSRLHAAEDEDACPPHPAPAIVRHCGKLEALDRVLPKLQATGHRVLLFATQCRALDVLEDFCGLRGFACCRLDGTTQGGERGASASRRARCRRERFFSFLG